MLLAGGSVALNKGFNPRTFWDDVRRFEATITIAIHGMVTFLLDQPPADSDRDHPLKTVYMGPLGRHEEFAERFGVDIYTAFGMAEVPVPITSRLNPTDIKSGYCGEAADPVPYELRLVDEHDVPVEVGTPGELVARHSLPWMINSGYKNMPEATANAWRNGWFHTGDEMVQDEAGSFYFLDRKKDVIRRRGVNISSFEVETEVKTHPLVNDAAVIAVKNPDLDEAAGDEEVMAVVVLEPGAELDPAELVDYLAGQMPRHWVPRFIEYVPELPRTPTHKVMKVELRERGALTPGVCGSARRPASSSSANRCPDAIRAPSPSSPESRMCRCGPAGRRPPVHGSGRSSSILFPRRSLSRSSNSVMPRMCARSRSTSIKKDSASASASGAVSVNRSRIEAITSSTRVGSPPAKVTTRANMCFLQRVAGTSWPA